MKTNSEWLQEWQSDPQARVAVIIHVDGEPQQYAESLKKQGVSVVHIFRLTRTIAANGPAQCILDLLQVPWVTRIEPDQTITTMKQRG